MGDNEKEEEMDSRQPTFINKLFNFIYLENEGDDEALNAFDAFIKNEEFDSDCIELEFQHKYGHFKPIINKKTHDLIIKFVKLHQLASSQFKLLFDTGYIFFYWPYYDNIESPILLKMQTRERWNGYNVNNYNGESIQDLFVSKHFDSLREEVLNSGFLSISTFKEGVIDKVMQYIKSQKCKRMKCIERNDSL